MAKTNKEEYEVLKNIEWLKREIGNMPYTRLKRVGMEDYVAINKSGVFELINQLDEPEVLSWEWIDEHRESTFDLDEDFETVFIKVDDLQNLLVPKQELPVIPQFVAEWIDSRKNNYPSDVIGVYLRMNESSANEQTREVLSWVHESELNRGSFARAWLDGYEVEKEQKYILSINITDKASKTNYETFLNKRGIFHSMENESFNSEEFNWSEEEIKDLESGEILFEHFATKVEELEE